MSWSIIRCICRSFRGQKSSRRALFCRNTVGEGETGPVRLGHVHSPSHPKDLPGPPRSLVNIYVNVTSL